MPKYTFDGELVEAEVASSIPISEIKGRRYELVLRDKKVVGDSLIVPLDRSWAYLSYASSKFDCKALAGCECVLPQLGIHGLCGVASTNLSKEKVSYDWIFNAGSYKNFGDPMFLGGDFSYYAPFVGFPGGF